MFLFIISTFLIASLGYLAQTTGLCLVRGVNEALSGKPLFLLAILFSGSMAWTSMLIGGYLDIDTPFISYEFSILAIIGGLLFGLGTAFNNGCGVSTISKLARGQLAMIFTITGWLVGWVLLSTFVPSHKATPYIIDPSWHYGVLIVTSILILLLITRLNKDNKRIWLSMLMIGLMAGLVFLSEPKWTPSSLLKDISFSLWDGDSHQWPDVTRFVLIGSLIFGMFVAAVKAKTFSFISTNFKDCCKHLTAGVLMGIGAAIASGGNDSQLLLGLPSLSPAGVTTVFFMLCGIALGRKMVRLNN